MTPVGAPRVELSAGDRIVGVGFDACDIAVWTRCIRRRGRPLLESVYREAELAYCEYRCEQLATRHAAKEAVSKVLGTGFRAGIRPLDIEVVASRSGAPTVRMHGDSWKRAAALGIDTVHLTLCHESGFGFAWALGISRSGNRLD